MATSLRKIIEVFLLIVIVSLGTSWAEINTDTIKTIKIGDQTWMAGNLNIEVSPSWCYENNSDNCAKYGRLYTWEAATAACPKGWHLPTRDEWGVLISTMGGFETAGKKLKTKTGWAALPGGGLIEGVKFRGIDTGGMWWTSSGNENSTTVWYVEMMRNQNLVNEFQSYKHSGFSVRCLQNRFERETKPFITETIPKAFKTVKIGNQTWMAENLNINIGKSWCYNNNESYCVKYGRLYDWETARKACPDGWHLPTHKEWRILVEEVGVVAGAKLKAKYGWEIGVVGYGSGFDNYGFSALPGGSLSTQVSGPFAGKSVFIGDKYDGRWWTATETSMGSAVSRIMNKSFNDVALDDNCDKRSGLSVRCVQD